MRFPYESDRQINCELNVQVDKKKLKQNKRQNKGRLKMRIYLFTPNELVAKDWREATSKDTRKNRKLF